MASTIYKDLKRIPTFAGGNLTQFDGVFLEQSMKEFSFDLSNQPEKVLIAMETIPSASAFPGDVCML